MTNRELDSCKRDIEIIKSTIEKTKVNLGSISKIFIVYGMLEFILLFTNLIVSRFHWYGQIQSIIFGVLHFVTLIILLLLFIRNYMAMQRKNHSYTLQLLHIWGIAMFVFPIYSIISVLATFFVDSAHFADNIRIILLALPEFSEILFFMGALLYTGFLLNKKFMIISALALMISVIPMYHLGANFANITSPSIIYGYLHLRALIFKFIILLGYIIMGFKLLPKQESHYGIE